jgi:hypothetical protein
MSDNPRPYCPECDDQPDQPETLDRRNFIRVVGGSTAALSLAGLAGGVSLARADETKKTDEKAPKPAEALVKELYASLTDDQKKELILPWDHGSRGGKATPTRLRMYNSPIGRPIGVTYTKAQQELIERIIKAISSGEEGFTQLSRNGNWDTFRGRGMEDCGATFFGELGDGKKYAWVFTGHHLTVRCDGDWEDGVGFGGPMFYGHSPNGYSKRNVFNYQTRAVLSVFEALSEEQRKQAVVKGSPGEGQESVKLRGEKETRPGIGYDALTKDQRKLVEEVMRTILSPYRKEDADEVMAIVKATGGLEKLALAFYPDLRMKDGEPWHFWRLEGPGFVWNYRVLPHVHTYVNVTSKG